MDYGELDDLYYFDAGLRMGCYAETDSMGDETETEEGGSMSCESLSLQDADVDLDLTIGECSEETSEDTPCMQVWVDIDGDDCGNCVEVPMCATVGQLKYALRTHSTYDPSRHDLCCGSDLLDDNESSLSDLSLHENDFHVRIHAKVCIVARDSLRKKGVKRTPHSLLRRIRLNDEEVVAQLLASGVSATSTHDSRHPIGASALLRSHDAITQLLLAYGADLNAPPVQEVIVRKATAVRIKQLLALGFTPHTLGFSTLVWVAVNREPDVLDALLAAGCDHFPPSQPKSLLSHMAGSYGVRCEAIEVVKRHGGDVNKRDRDTDRTPFMHAVGIPAVGIEILRALSPSDVNAADHAGNTALLLLMKTTYISRQALGYLVAMGADVNVAMPNEKTPLLLSAEKGRTIVSQDLIKAGADVNYATSKGVSPLCVACYYRYLDLSKVLVASGAHPDPTFVLFDRSPSKLDRFSFLAQAGIPFDSLISLARSRDDSRTAARLELLKLKIRV